MGPLGFYSFFLMKLYPTLFKKECEIYPIQMICIEEFILYYLAYVTGGNEDKGDIVSLPTVMIPQQKSVKSDKIGSKFHSFNVHT